MFPPAFAFLTIALTTAIAAPAAVATTTPLDDIRRSNLEKGHQGSITEVDMRGAKLDQRRRATLDKDATAIPHPPQ